jgi:hypothetical protein
MLAFLGMILIPIEEAFPGALMLAFLGMILTSNLPEFAM